jgi:hypothetical protein
MASRKGSITHGVPNYSLLTITIGDDTRPKRHLINHETAFNIHNPNLDHRDRGRRLRLPSYLQIENASDQVQRLTPNLSPRRFRSWLTVIHQE